MKQVLVMLLALAATSLAEYATPISTTGYVHSHPNCTTTVFTTITPKPSIQTAFTTSTITITITNTLPITGKSTSIDSSTRSQLRREHSHSDLPSRSLTSAKIPYPTTNNTISTSYNTTTHPHHTSFPCHTKIIKTIISPSTITTTSTLTVTTTLTPSSSCTPGVCGTYTFTPCPSAPLGDCLCGLDPDGQVFCSLDDWCQNEIGCDTNAECLTPEGLQTGEGFRCLVGSCCDNEVVDDGQGGGSVVKKKGKCVKEKGAVCLNEAVAVQGVLRLRRVSRVVKIAAADGGGKGRSNGGRC